MRIIDHPILGPFQPSGKSVTIYYNGESIAAYEGEMIATALIAAGIKTFRFTMKKGEPRGIFCAIGRCTDCVMEVNGQPNVRTCVTAVKDKMNIRTQNGLGVWRHHESNK